MYSMKFGRLVFGLCTEAKVKCPTSLVEVSPAVISSRTGSSWTVCKHRRQFLVHHPHGDRQALSFTIRSNTGNLTVRSASHTTVDPTEVKKFQSLANKWWNLQGEFAPLHSMNDLRVPFIRDHLLNAHSGRQWGSPLAGIRILDVGCGGGLLTEPLGRLGADVLGIDPVEDSVRAAERHASSDPDLRERVRYRACTLEELAEGGGAEGFHAAVASEVVEHLADLDSFAGCCHQVLKPGGSLFITTINKTNLSYVLGIVAAERVLRIVPDGTHDWEKFVSPVDLERLLESLGFYVESIRGMLYNPLTGAWSWTQSTAVNYALHAVKRTEEPQPDRARADGEELEDQAEPLTRAAAGR